MQLSTLAISIALAATASADTLRGATNTATLNQLAHPDVHCNQKDHTATDCSDAISSDGSSCVWCQTSEEQGACLSRSDADSVINLFNLPCPAYSALLEEEESEDSTDEEEDSMDEEEENVELSL
jgi:hypothetical protein